MPCAEAMVLNALLLLQDNMFAGECPEALRLMHRAAELGCADAYACLGQMYTYGIGVPKDALKGGEYLCLGAGYGSDFSESLMMSGADKYGWPLDPQLRRELLEALRQNRNESLNSLGGTAEWKAAPTPEQLRLLGKAIGDMTGSPAQRSFVNAACALMDDSRPKNISSLIAEISDAAAHGLIGASTFLASVYLQCKLVSRDAMLAVQLLKDDADMGWTQAMYMLSKLYDAGDGIPRDPHEAWRYAKMAADGGHADAKFAVGQMYRLGHGVELDLKQAVAYLSDAANNEHPAAMYVLAFMYFRGEGVDMNVNRCVSLLKLAAEAGHIEAMISLAEFYGGDLGIAADPEKALHWLSLAADRGSDRADELLGRMCGALGEEE